MANISTIIEPTKSVVSDVGNSIISEHYLINITGNLGGLDIAVTGTHNIIPIAADTYIKSIDFGVKTAFTSGGSATLQLKIGAVTYTGAMTVANLATIDKTIHIQQVPDLTLTDTDASWYIGTADTLDFTVAAADFTAGVCLVVIHYIPNFFGENVT